MAYDFDEIATAWVCFLIGKTSILPEIQLTSIFSIRIYEKVLYFIMLCVYNFGHDNQRWRKRLKAPAMAQLSWTCYRGSFPVNFALHSAVDPSPFRQCYFHKRSCLPTTYKGTGQGRRYRILMGRVWKFNYQLKVQVLWNKHFENIEEHKKIIL